MTDYLNVSIVTRKNGSEVATSLLLSMPLLRDRHGRTYGGTGKDHYERPVRQDAQVNGRRFVFYASVSETEPQPDIGFSLPTPKVNPPVKRTNDERAELDSTRSTIAPGSPPLCNATPGVRDETLEDVLQKLREYEYDPDVYG